MLTDKRRPLSFANTKKSNGSFNYKRIKRLLEIITVPTFDNPYSKLALDQKYPINTWGLFFLNDSKNTFTSVLVLIPLCLPYQHFTCTYIRLFLLTNPFTYNLSGHSLSLERHRTKNKLVYRIVSFAVLLKRKVRKQTKRNP